jgi:hypothetical protein
MEQNYFQFNQQYCKQIDGLAMGAPTSATLAKTHMYNTRSIYKYTQS